MPTRRGFIGCLLAALPVLPLLPILPRLASSRAPTPVSAAPGIPRQMDIRHDIHPLAFDVEVSRHGDKLLNAVAYDLDADTVTVIAAVGLRGCHSYRTLHGGVAVTWIRS